jgi:hypothetical protein
MSPLDRLTEIVACALRVFLLQYPTRTGVGLVLGGVVAALMRALSPLVHDVPVDLDGVPLWGWVCLGSLSRMRTRSEER